MTPSAANLYFRRRLHTAALDSSESSTKTLISLSRSSCSAHLDISPVFTSHYSTARCSCSSPAVSLYAVDQRSNCKCNCTLGHVLDHSSHFCISWNTRQLTTVSFLQHCHMYDKRKNVQLADVFRRKGLSIRTLNWVQQCLTDFGDWCLALLHAVVVLRCSF